jgi:mannose-1-phosphate guanylyltransferase/phosphomannomutase
MIKQAVILSAGLGTRLRPYTDTIPKPMLPVLGKPILEWHIEQFKKYGVEEFFLNLHSLPDVITNYFGDGAKWGVKIHYHIEPTILGTAGGIKPFEDFIHDNFFLIYGDTFSLMNYGRMETAYAQKKDPIGMQRMKKTDDYADADVAELDVNGRFVKIHHKPHGEAYPNAYRMRGAFIFDKKIFGYIPDNIPFEIGKQLLPKILKVGKNFYSYECDDYSKGIDTVEKWKEVEAYLKQHS